MLKYIRVVLYICFLFISYLDVVVVDPADDLDFLLVAI